ncbi:MAG TPA: phage portal protein, partial [Lachnospiraceae bacterium]|nr:phage portal protein [Lachnospiraceae bacterium]
KSIFEQGQGIDPDPSNFGNASGVALKYLYSLLELRAGLMETEFKLGFGELIRAICRHLNLECMEIIQTWTRTSVTNDVELADIAQKSVGVISQRTILSHHPWVESTEQELKYLEEEESAKQEKMDMYQDAFKNSGDQMKQGEVDDEESEE